MSMTLELNNPIQVLSISVVEVQNPAISSIAIDWQNNQLHVFLVNRQDPFHIQGEQFTQLVNSGAVSALCSELSQLIDAQTAVPE
jgi:hypothetical protein